MTGGKRVSAKDFPTIDGNIHMRINPFMKQYSGALSQYHQRAIPLNDKLKGICKQLQVDLDTVTKTLGRLSLCLKEYSNLQASFNKKVIFGESDANHQVFSGLSHLFEILRMKNVEQTRLTKNYLTRAMKYTKNEIQALDEVEY